MNERSAIVVYTAVLGGYDELQPPCGANRTKARFMCFTDVCGSVCNGWEAQLVEGAETVDERVRHARWIKTHPHLLLGAHDVSIWIDANLELVVDPAELAAFVDAEEVATFAYPATYGPRDCIYQEAQACIDRGKDNPELIREQMKRYVCSGYPAHAGLVETSIVVRRNNDRAASFNEGWWREIRYGSRRDQLSFNYVSREQGIDYARLPGSRLRSAFARHYPHAVAIYPR